MKIRLTGTPVSSSNGREALDLYDKENDLILLDIQMPEVSGYDVIKAIKEKEKITGEHTCVIATTASAMSQDKLKEYILLVRENADKCNPLSHILMEMRAIERVFLTV